jgi:hypothetical protein
VEADHAPDPAAGAGEVQPQGGLAVVALSPCELGDRVGSLRVLGGESLDVARIAPLGLADDHEGTGAEGLTSGARQRARRGFSPFAGCDEDDERQGAGHSVRTPQ